MIASIIVPVHNESDNIIRFLTTFINEITKYERIHLYEILLVENGSNDNSFDICKSFELSSKGLVKVLQIVRPSYGEAIKTGILTAKGEIAIILECDFMNAQFVTIASDLIKSGIDMVIASKMLKNSEDSRPFKRRILTCLFNRYLKLFFNYPGSDTHGLKAIEINKARILCNESITTDEVFQTEIVLLAYKFNYKVVEVPITITETRSTPVNIIKRLPKVIMIIRELNKSLARYKK